ncbi:hypothetical protein MRB53_021341 [Persea americana]|uniref:Uncharacterized protein n=1 Tax=Persea americana TaxID=3435 RepID=A0ACC2L4S1_PERAE|nr:hypothetical protein MRB53_021341 [Persea americana]
MEHILGWIGQTIPAPQISEQVGYVSNLKRNVEALMEEAQKLKDQCDDMESEGQEASRKRMRLTNQARTWLGHARANLTEIENIKSEFDRRQTSNSGFFSDFPSTYTVGKRAVEKLESVRRELNERSGIKLLAMSSPPRVMEMDVPTVGQSSSQQTMEKIWDLLHDEHNSVICVYGMGGIGKTTLMKAINNKLQATSEFDYVIWVTVSKELNLQRIQKEIMSRLHLKIVEDDSYNIRSMQLQNRRITAVPRSFFELMPALQVLDLSFTSITSLSVSSSSLLNLRALILRGCRRLTEVPLLGQLKELQFLDIKSSGIRSLPEEMQNLVKLKKINMSDLLSDPLTIPSDVISGLSSLEDLRMLWAEVNWAKGSELAVENVVALGEVGKLKRLTILKITIQDFDCVEDDVFLQQLPKLEKFKVVIGPSNSLRIATDGKEFKDYCMKQVHICRSNNYSRGVKVMVAHTEGLKLFDAYVKDVSQLVGDANGLRMLTLRRCPKMECILDWNDVGKFALQNIEKLELKMLPKLQKLFKGEVPQRCLRKLNKIYLSSCDNLKSLFSSEMVQNLDQLQTLDVMSCFGLEEIIEGHDKSLPENPFPQLRNFTLSELYNLKSIICRDTLALPSLIKLKIYKCSNLRLPKRPDTTDWPSITRGGATWEANPQQS